jgi:hypothetical protein
VRGYRVCHTTGSSRIVCRNRRILGRSWDSFKLRITLPLIYKNGRGRRYVEFTWRVDRRMVARKRIKVFWDA